jgi:hypothetical protein
MILNFHRVVNVVFFSLAFPRLMYRRFGTSCLFHILRSCSTKMEQTGCSERSVHNIHRPVEHPKEWIEQDNCIMSQYYLPINSWLYSTFKHRVKSHLPFTSIISRFKVYGSLYRKYIPIYVYIQQDATLHSLFISANCSTCPGWYFHTSSGAHTTVYTAFGICAYATHSTLKPVPTLPR